MARCTADTLDAADDVCDGCGQPFCEDHLIRPRGAKKKPLCSECAVVKAGLRHKEIRTPQASRSEVRKNRKMVRKADKVSMAEGFEYFDEQPSSESGDSARAMAAAFDDDPDTSKRGRLRRKKSNSDDPILADAVEEAKSRPAAQSSAADLWEQIRADAPPADPEPGSLSPPPPTSTDEPWAAPGPFEPEPEKGMPSTFDAPRQQIPAPPAPAQAPPPPAPAPPRPATDGASLAPTPGSAPTSWAAPEPAPVRSTPPPPAAGIHPAASAPAFEDSEPTQPAPARSWTPAEVNDLDLGFDAVDAVDGLGRRIGTPQAAPEPAPARAIPPAFASKPSHPLPAALRPPDEASDDESTSDTDLPEALRPR